MSATPRQCTVHTAQGWYDSAREAQRHGRMSEALLCMANAFNHTENALNAVLQAATFKDQPPMSGRPRKTLTELRGQSISPTHRRSKQGVSRNITVGKIR